jgi:hypothetical protein
LPADADGVLSDLLVALDLLSGKNKNTGNAEKGPGNAFAALTGFFPAFYNHTSRNVGVFRNQGGTDL